MRFSSPKKAILFARLMYTDLTSCMDISVGEVLALEVSCIEL